MTKTWDTRSRNWYPSPGANAFEYLTNYSALIPAAIKKVGRKNFMAAIDLLKMVNVQPAGRIFAGGNGGSAAIADHLTCDLTKGTATDNQKNLIVHSLNGQTALFTAIGNDLGYEKTLSYQLELYKISSKDCVVLISSSGNSRNIIDACLYAKERGADVIGMTGFDGGELKKLSTISLHVPIANYGIVEDCHQVLMHVLAQCHWLAK